MAQVLAGRSFLATFALVFLAIAGLFAADTFLAKTDRTESQIEANRLFDEGLALMKQGKNPEAVERLNDAIAIERDNRDYLLTLAEAEFAGGATAAAETTLTDLLNKDSTDGHANLILARVLEKEGHFAEAVSYFHRAIYGHWTQDADGNRRRARIELIDLLAQHSAKAELLAELLPLQETAPHDQQTLSRMGKLFLLAGSPGRAADLFHQMERADPHSATAYAGLGEAEFVQGDYRSAKHDFEASLRLSPDDLATQHRLDLCNELLQLDPSLRGLGSEERFHRSLKLVDLTQQSVTGCLEPNTSPQTQDLLKKADTALKTHVTAAHQSDRTEANLDLSVQLWQARKKECKSPEPSDSPLVLVLAKLAR